MLQKSKEGLTGLIGITTFRDIQGHVFRRRFGYFGAKREVLPKGEKKSKTRRGTTKS